MKDGNFMEKYLNPRVTWSIGEGFLFIHYIGLFIDYVG